MTRQRSLHPHPSTQRKPRRAKLALAFPASSSGGSLLDTGLARLFPEIFEITLLPLPSIGSLLSRCLATSRVAPAGALSGGQHPH